MHQFRPRSNNIASKVAASRTRRPRRQKPGLEALEGRRLLSLGGENLINVKTAGSQLLSDNASAANGRSVIVWTDRVSSTNDDVRARVFDSTGAALTGDIIVEGSSSSASVGGVAMDADGDFVVTYSMRSGGDSNIFAQRYSSNGTKQGDAILVAGTPKFEFDADVAMDADGDFVVTYSLDFNSTDRDVLARRYSRTGTFLGEIRVGATGSFDEERPSIGMAPDGRFAIAFETKDNGSQSDIRLVRYSPTGAVLGSHLIAGTSASELTPSVALDDSGNAVIAYMKEGSGNFDVKARRLGASGSVGTEINVRSTSAHEGSPSVALKRTGGAFVVAYDVIPAGSGGQVGVTEISADNLVVGQHTLPATNFQPAVSIDADGDYVLTYTGITGNDDRNIHRRLGRLA